MVWQLTFVTLLCALVAASHGRAADPYTPYGFTDAESLPVPDRANDGHPLDPDGKPPYPAWYPQGALVDLHAHAFMDRGLGPMFHGDFNSPLRATSWSDRFSSQINADTLDASGLGLVIVSLYAHPVLAPARKNSIRRQISDAREFVRARPNWVIARGAREAREAYARGKRVMVLSIEGASGILDSEDDFKDLIDKEGVSIVTFAHLSDDKLTGAALLPGYHILGNPRGMIPALFSRQHDAEGALLNPNGLTEYGSWVASRLLARHVWIDLSHAPEKTADALIPMLRAAGQPLLYTHTALRRHMGSERGLSHARLRQVAESGGIVGIVPADSYTGDTPVPPGNCPPGSQCLCKGGIFALAAQYNEIASEIGEARTFIGTDFNGVLDHLPPIMGCLSGTTLDQKGFYNISQTGEFWVALRFAGARSKASESAGVENFLSVWERVSSKSPPP